MQSRYSTKQTEPHFPLRRAFLDLSPPPKKSTPGPQRKGERGAERCVEGEPLHVKKGAKKIWILLPDCANPMIVGSRLVSFETRRTVRELQRGGGGSRVSKSKGRRSDVIQYAPSLWRKLTRAWCVT
jgi:hypothetical protein